MKRRALLRHLHAHGCVLFREGARHSIYWNPAEQQTSSVPRHSDIHEFLAKKICRDLHIPSP